MTRKKGITPKGKIVSALRQMWLRSRERSAAEQRDGYKCQNCGVKKSRKKGAVVKTQVHHLERIDWDKILKPIRKHLLPDISKLETLCTKCHDKKHEKKRKVS